MMQARLLLMMMVTVLAFYAPTAARAQISCELSAEASQGFQSLLQSQTKAIADMTKNVLNEVNMYVGTISDVLVSGKPSSSQRTSLARQWLNGLSSEVPSFSAVLSRLGSGGPSVPGMPGGIIPNQQAEIGLLNAELRLRTKMVSWWQGFNLALRGNAAQEYAGYLDQTRNLLSVRDAALQVETVRLLGGIELDSIRTHQPTAFSCQIDTAAKSAGRAQHISRAITLAAEADSTALGTNMVGSLSEPGGASYLSHRVTKFQDLFANPEANGARIIAHAVSPSMYDADVLPGRTLLGRYTLDLSSINRVEAMRALSENLTMFRAGEVVPGARGTGGQVLLKNREALAQMNAVMAIPMRILSERAPGEAAPHIMQMRHSSAANATDISPTPSKREIRQAIVENVTDLKFHYGLNDTPVSASQKELYLQGFNLTLLYELIEKTEMIGTAFAIQGTNLLDVEMPARSGAATSAPFDVGGTR